MSVRLAGSALGSAPSDTRPLGARQRFGSYQVLACLDFGVLGGLYRVKTLRGGEVHIIHVLPQQVRDLPQIDSALASYVAEAAKIRHDGILAPLRVEEIAERPCLIYPDAPGQTINEIAAADGIDRLSPRQVHGLVDRIAQAVDAAHQAGHAHRALSGGLILASGELKPKVIGFGLMDMIGQETFERIVSAGVPPFSDGGPSRLTPLDVLPPEARHGRRSDQRADVFALGTVTYFLLTGQTPSSPVLAASKLVSRVNPRWDRLIESALQADPDRRYADVKAFRKDLALLEGTRPGQISRRPGQTASPIAESEEAPEEAKSGKKGKKRPRKEKKAREKPAKEGEASGGRSHLRLFLIAGLGFLAIGAVAIIGLPIMLASKTDEVALVQQARDREPNLILTVVPSGAIVRFQNDEQFLVSDGQIELQVPRGDHTMTVTAPGHAQGVREIAMEGSLQQVHVRLTPTWAELEVRAEPGTRVLAQSDKRTIELGTVGDDGVLLVEDTLAEGSYELLYEADRLESVRETVELPANERVVREIVQEAKKAVLDIVTDPAGATVEIEGRSLGKTPLRVQAFPVDRPVELKISHPQYRTQSITHQMRPGESAMLNLGRLDRKTGLLLPTITFAGRAPGPDLLANLKIYVNEEPWEGSPRILTDLPAGRTTLRLEHPNYRTWQESIEIEDGGTAQVLADLEPQPALLDLSVSPMTDYTLLINGFPVSIRKNPIAVEPLVPLNLEVRAKNYSSATQTLRLEPNQKTAWRVVLQRLRGPEDRQPWTIPYLGLEMVWIRPGSYSMGSPLQEAERLPVEGPETEVRLTRGYWLGRYEITQDEYYALTGRRPSRFTGERHPVENVSWEDAVRFCEALTEIEYQAGRLPPGYVYRLPTEAEWEYGARAGSETPFWFGSRADVSHANLKGSYPSNSSKSETETYGTHPVGAYAGNPWGLYDTHGNVREWCYDTFASRLPGDRVTDRVGEADTLDRVYRGGGWEDPFRHGRSASRDRLAADSRSPSLGFRVALAPSLEE